MILVDKQIIQILDALVDPYDVTLVNPSSLDFRLGDQYTKIKPSSADGVDPLDKGSFRNHSFQANEYLLKPNEVILVSMYEKLTLPRNISAEIKGKSSLARLGLQNSAEGGYIDAGWSGYITLELTNHASYPIKLTHKMKIGQLILFKHKKVAKDYSLTGRYQNQKPGEGSKGI